VAAEEFEHPVEGFKNTYYHHYDDEVVYCPIALLQKLPVQKKEE
jgi:hypothetical protein